MASATKQALLAALSAAHVTGNRILFQQTYEISKETAIFD